MEKTRLCQGCFNQKTVDNMLKITKLKDGTLKLNPNSKELGRSVYVCKNKECIKQFIKKHRLQKGLRYYNQKEIQNIEQQLTQIIF